MSVPISSTRTAREEFELRPATSQHLDLGDRPSASRWSGTYHKYRAVIVCLASFLIVFTSCGTVFAFGVYQELYEQMARQPGTPFTGSSPAVIDLIGTLSVAFMTIGAPFATAWSKRLSPRAVICTGGLLFFLGHLFASLGTKLWHFELAQGLMIGLGTCLAYMPAVTVSPPWFTSRRGVAMGIILSGTGVGGVVWAPAISATVARFGFRTSLRMSGAITGGLIVVASLFMDWDDATKARLQADNARLGHLRPRQLLAVPLMDWQLATKNRTFIAHLIGAFLQSAAYYTPVFFLSAYARTLGYSSTTGATFIAITNACNAIGKIVIGFLADRYGRMHALLYTTLASALVCLCLWLPSTMTSDTAAGRGLFVTYAVTYGIFASAYISLFPTSLVELFGPAHFAGVNGVLYMARGFASLLGTPLAGALIRGSTLTATSPWSYWPVALLVGSLLASASASVFWVVVESKRNQVRAG